MNDKPRNSYFASLRSNNLVTRSVIFDKRNFVTKPTKEEATGHNIADNLITIIAKIIFMVYFVAQCMTTAFCLCNRSTARSLLSFNMEFICFKPHSINKWIYRNNRIFFMCFSGIHWEICGLVAIGFNLLETNIERLKSPNKAIVFHYFHVFFIY